LNVIPGIKEVFQEKNIFNHYDLLAHSNKTIKINTIPELESRGLGFIYSSYDLRYIITCNSKILLDSTDIILPLTDQPIEWGKNNLMTHCGPSFPFNLNLVIYSNFYLVKIGDSSQHATLPQNFTATLFSYSIYTKFGESGTPIPGITLNSTFSISEFSTNVVTRTCATPAASESTIYFDTHQQSNIQSMLAGTAFAQRDFTFTFVCPRKRYDSISFLVEPMYGIEPAYPGTMKIASGTGMARGVGVQLFVQAPKTLNSNEWSISNLAPAIYRSDPLSNDGIGPANGKYPLFHSYVGGASYNDTSYWLINDEAPTIQRTVNFKANLIRLPGQVQPGQIKAAALIHIRYN